MFERKIEFFWELNNEREHCKDGRKSVNIQILMFLQMFTFNERSWEKCMHTNILVVTMTIYTIHLI